MLLVEETYPAIDVYKLIHFIILRAERKAVPIGDFSLLDVNDKEDFLKERLIEAEHYNRMLLSRNHFETEVLNVARRNNVTLIVYGQGAGTTTNILNERGYKAVMLNGNLRQFKEVMPRGLISKGNDEQFDIFAMKSVLEHKANSRRGERLWRSTSASRIKTAGRSGRTKEKPLSAMEQRRAWR